LNQHTVSPTTSLHRLRPRGGAVCVSGLCGSCPPRPRFAGVDDPVTDERVELRADCSRCFALCCVASELTRSADFAIDKPAGVACLHLADEHRCSIHDRLVPAGFPGCVAFDCFGAGQRLAQETFGGRDWRTHPEVAAPMMAAFPLMRGLHELLWYLHEALTWPGADVPALRAALDDVEGAAGQRSLDLLDTDVSALRATVAPLLRAASAVVREGTGGPDLAEADLAGADLRGVDLSLADLLGADLRGADVRGAALADALFLTRTQLQSARRDETTAVPASLLGPPPHPGRWAAR
jgi:uncharacterized protein YjbI with pentapeptide repeats